MKKKILILLALVLCVLVGCEKKYVAYNEVTIDELDKMVEAHENFVLVIGSESCSACKSYKPIMEKVIRTYNLKINYINVAALSEKELARLMTYAYYNATPTTVFFENGVVTGSHDFIIGAADYDKIVNSLIKKGYIDQK